MKTMEGFGMIDKVEVSAYMRPVRLTDVLLAIKEKYKGKVFLQVRDTGTLYLGDYQYGNGLKEVTGHKGGGIREDIKEVGKWNLLDDNLNNQSPETLDFIHNLLCTAK